MFKPPINAKKLLNVKKKKISEMNAHQYHPLLFFILALLPRQSKPQGQAGEGQWPDQILLGTAAVPLSLDTF